MPNAALSAPEAPPQRPPAQTPREAERLYHVDAWGNGYFFVNEAGHAAVRPSAGSEAAIDLHAAAEMLRAEGVSFPAVLRFPDLLRTRVERLHAAFGAAIEAAGYAGAYRGVYPIKVNQLRPVVEAVLRAGRPHHFGLECGSRAELVAALPHIEGEALLICNGCKDPQMMRLLAEAQRVGKRALPVLERASEFEMLRRAAAVTEPSAEAPLAFGVRVRLSASGTGLWSESSGAHSKFGLSLAELLALADALESEPALRFRLVHFHLGSQIADLASVRDATREAARLYAALRQRGLPLDLLDIGGGLGVPYEAGNPDAAGWVGYTLDAYTRAVVEAAKSVCDDEGVPHPTLVSESGRALTAYHAVFVTDVLETRTKAPPAPGAPIETALHGNGKPSGKKKEASEGERRLAAVLEKLRVADENVETPVPAEALRALHAHAEEARRSAAERFRAGLLSLRAKAAVEKLYGAACYALGRHAARLGPAAERSPALSRLAAQAADHYLCNFSVFRSIPDHWALGQRFPVMPLGRLLERPTRRATLIDLTCDSDGAVADFVTPAGTKPFLELHPTRSGEPYPLGFFLVGAYQDTLGDMHNLFGQPSDVSLELDAEAPGGFRVASCRPATRVAEQLAEVRYDAEALRARLAAQAERAAAAGQCMPAQAEALQTAYAAALDEATYLAAQHPPFSM